MAQKAAKPRKSLLMEEPSTSQPHAVQREANRSQRNLHMSTSGVYYVKPKTKQRTGAEIEEYKKEYHTQAHKLSIKELENRYDTNVQTGLTQEEADDLLSTLGPNCLIAPPSKSRWILLGGFLFCGFAALLWVGSILSLISYVINLHKGSAHIEQLYLSVILVVVILVTGLFGFYQESVNASIIESFQKMTPKSATVVREGEVRVIPSEEVVVGDLVLLKGGEWIPADVRIIEAHGLKVENSAITGETVAQPRSADCTDDNVLETANLAFYSTSAVEGSGRGIVINTGDDTLIGHIAGLTSNLQKSTTPIRREINYFIKVITILALAIGVAFFVVCMVFQNDFFTSFTYFIALVVANVPEGLPVTLTACMTLTAKRMASKNCLVKKLEAIETLGCCNVICSDKTGTLTQNKMTVSHMFFNNTQYQVMYQAMSPGEDKVTFGALARIAILCNNAEFRPGQDEIPADKREVIGDASETAILKSMELLVGRVDKVRTDNKKVCEIPFNSTNKYQVSVHKQPNKSFVVLMKGAPERVLEKCKTIFRNGKNDTLSESTRSDIKKALYTLGNKGERVLAFADLELDSKFGENFKFDADAKNFPLEGLRFVGLMSMIDPPRPSVPYAVSKCQSAGIRVIMVTGDHPITASAIAKQVGILSPSSVTPYDLAMKRNVSISMVSTKEKSTCNAAVITGTDLREMSDEELRNCLIKYEQIVFARTSPQQKLKIVEAFQNLKKVVAVTGDGVNDSPALKKADIGIAMGITGSDVSKEAADMVLLDDNFASIVTGIEEGRLIFDNLKKSIAYLLTSNVPEIVPFILMVVFHFPPQVGVISVLVIDVGTDLWPAISLAYEKAEADIMTRNPRDPKIDKLVNHRLIFLTYLQIGVIQTCAAYTAYFNVMNQYGFDLFSLHGLYPAWVNGTKIVKDEFGQSWTPQERTVITYKCYSAFFLSIVMTQIADLLICKTRRLSLFQQGMTNWVLNAGIIFEIALAAFLVFCPGLNTALQFAPIGFEILLPTIPFALFILIYDEVRKTCIRRYPQGIVYKETYY